MDIRQGYQRTGTSTCPTTTCYVRIVHMHHHGSPRRLNVFKRIKSVASPSNVFEHVSLATRACNTHKPACSSKILTGVHTQQGYQTKPGSQTNPPLVCHTHNHTQHLHDHDGPYRTHFTMVPGLNSEHNRLYCQRCHPCSNQRQRASSGTHRL